MFCRWLRSDGCRSKPQTGRFRPSSAREAGGWKRALTGFDCGNTPVQVSSDLSGVARGGGRSSRGTRSGTRAARRRSPAPASGPTWCRCAGSRRSGTGQQLAGAVSSSARHAARRSRSVSPAFDLRGRRLEHDPVAAVRVRSLDLDRLLPGTPTHAPGGDHISSRVLTTSPAARPRRGPGRCIRLGRKEMRPRPAAAPGGRGGRGKLSCNGRSARLFRDLRNRSIAANSP